MTEIRQHIEKWFETLARIVFAHRLKTLGILMLIIGMLAAHIPKLAIDTSMEGFLHADDPILRDYNAFRDQFGRDEVIIIAVKPTDVFDLDFLEKLRSLHRELADNVPYIDDITSLINARNTRGDADALIVEDLLEEWPEDAADLALLRKRVLSDEMYRNLLVSEDGRFTTIVIRTHSHSAAAASEDVLAGFEDGAEEKPGNGPPLETGQKYLTDAENSEAVTAARRIAEKYDAPDFKVFVAGSPVVTHFLKKAMMKDMRKFMALSLGTIAVCLFLMFRRLSGVLLPICVVIATLLSTLGIMALAGTAIKLPTQILPSFLLAVCVGASVHILAVFYHRLRVTSEKRDALAWSMGHSGLAVVMTGLTTSAGLLSFSTAEVAPIADIGVFAGAGVLMGLLYTLVLLPAMVAIFPIRLKKKAAAPKKALPMDRVLSAIAGISTGHPWTVILVSFLVILGSAIAASTLQFSHAPLQWFPEDNAIRTATETIDRELRGSLSLEVVVDTGEENGLHDPSILNRLEEAADYAESLQFEDLFIGKAWSLTSILKEIHQALNENRPEFYAIPQNPELVAQEFLLFENSGSDDLEDLVDSRFSKARLILKAPFDDAIKYGRFMDHGGKFLKEKFPEATITLTGMMALLARILSNTMVTLARSYITALVIITILMIVLIGRVRIGFLSMIPNLAPILLTMGLMGLFSMPMDLFTMLVGSISIGLAVDDTIHFMHNFRRYYEESGDPVWAVHETLHTTGRAMLVTTIVLSIGFFIFTFATMKNLFNFGMLTAFTITMALVADYFIAPALMVVVNKKRRIQ